MAWLTDFFLQVIWFMKEAAPYMILGILIAGMLRHVFSEERFAGWFGGNDFKSVLMSALLGIPLPLCSCSVLPTMVSLRRRGASKGATVSFLISTPETGVDSISVTYALLDPIFTVARPIAALVSALFTGSMVNLLVRKGWDRPAPAEGESMPCECEDGAGCAVGGDASKGEGGGKEAPEGPRASFLRKSLRYGFGPLMDDLTPLLVLAFAGSGLIAVLLPSDFFSHPITQGWSGMFLMLFVGIPFYVCATSSTPLVAALLLKGLSPGAALVFLLAGPVTNLGTILAVNRFLGTRVMAIYLACTSAVALLMGGMIDTLYRDLAIPVTAIVGKSQNLLPEPVKIAALLLLLFFMARSAVRIRLLPRWIDRVRARCRPLGFDPIGKGGAVLLSAAAAVLVLATTFTRVDPGEMGWVLTFGRVERDAQGAVILHGPGLLLHWPYPFQEVRTARQEAVRNLNFGFRDYSQLPQVEPSLFPDDQPDESDLAVEAEVMDGQESLVSLKFSLQYRLLDPYAFAMEFKNPEELIQGYAAAAVREACARRATQDILVGHRRELEEMSRDRLQQELDRLGAGVKVCRVLFVDVHAPPEVHFAFRDVASASEDKHKQELQGESEFRKTLADARGRAFRIEQEAESAGYLSKSRAAGLADAFLAKADAFRKTEKITRLRLYLAAMQSALSRAPLVLPLGDGIDVELWVRGAEGKAPARGEKQSKGGEKESSRAPAPVSTEPPASEKQEPPWMQAIRH